MSPGNYLEPLVLFSGSSVLYILNLKRGQIVSYLRGHGGVSVLQVLQRLEFLNVRCYIAYNVYRSSPYLPSNILYHIL
jgi:hypothetical protein